MFDMLLFNTKYEATKQLNLLCPLILCILRQRSLASVNAAVFIEFFQGKYENEHNWWIILIGLTFAFAAYGQHIEQTQNLCGI